MVTFAMVLFGNAQIKYLKVLLQSIIEVYQEKASIILYYAGIDSKYVEEIKRKIPSILLKEDKSLDYSSKDFDCKASFKTNGWCKIAEEQRWPEHLVFLDIDTLIVRKVDNYFDKYMGKADIGYTYKTNEDENLKWPINSGVVIVNNTFLLPRFFRDWRDKTLVLLKDWTNERRNQRRLWGGEDQAAMGDILGTRDRKQFSEIIVSDNILLKGFPCEELNETRCVPITNKTHIIHYKGSYWPSVLSTGKFSQWRPKEKCQKMYELWTQTLKRWNEVCG